MSAPRRNVGVGGFAVRAAQSSGDRPGASRTFLDGRADGASVDVDGARDVLFPRGAWPGGTRREDAEEGGWRKEVGSLGGARDLDVGRGGGGIRDVVGPALPDLFCVFKESDLSIGLWILDPASLVSGGLPFCSKSG